MFVTKRNYIFLIHKKTIYKDLKFNKMTNIRNSKITSHNSEILCQSHLSHLKDQN